MALRTDWNGVFPAMVTPFRENGSFDEASFKALIELYISEGVKGVVVTGSTGEWYSMSDAERATVWEVAVEASSGRITVIAGTSAVGTREALALTRTAKAVGVDGCMLLPPGGIFAARNEVVNYFHTLAGVGLPIMVYNNPPRTGVNMDADMVAEIAKAEEIVSFKDSNRDLYAASEIIYRVCDKLAVFTGLEPYASSVLPRGAVGVVSTISNVCAANMVSYYNAVISGDSATAYKTQKLIDQLYHFLPTLGAPAFVSVKAAMKLLGRPGGEIRLPHLPANEALIGKLREELRRLKMSDAE
ncbi:dihydrodipicolinate synthase family protein [Sinorhizobium meliloti]|uniref:dihydrodipicolinate synthase family protein n=1 Tax=Rhizobium meliloti TaxID=382 RepID=UPI000FD8EC5F|nr:dihydrodipicolinate synthase family protein [Sinorhizobium meliloti]MDW9682900.1 dihydrodipicolinate synthase family protein [Sinorhizobium meliloti]MDW9694025.1 dihydrodipicolinate synthase family protein [Sinorhizobium meliloti]MDW9718875.1 dihydrodipicolinate synthase family protein [Sinorhizobium meliloti]MDW9756071.1 dihydrodipicolinate synthase family protein [Sinorhizobium meliloti]MDW9985620.1 dihydrodipicolinate synthase family protein [Sinorhizobium meliloti]